MIFLYVHVAPANILRVTKHGGVLTKKLEGADGESTSVCCVTCIHLDLN